MTTETQNPKTSGLEAYITAAEALEKSESHSPGWLRQIRSAGLAHFAQRGFPTIRHEEWRYTNVAPLAEMPVRFPTSGAEVEIPEGCSMAGLGAMELVFVDGFFAPSLSTLRSLPKGLTVEPLASALRNNAALLEKHLTRYAPIGENPFSALNNALFSDGCLVHASKGVTCEVPIHLLFLSGAQRDGLCTQPRVLVVAEENSRICVMETFAGVGEASVFNNALTEISVAEHARVEHIKLQLENFRTYHIALIEARLGRGAWLGQHSIALGSQLSRHNIHFSLDAERIDCLLNGLYLSKGTQLHDHHTLVDHRKPHCSSHEFYHGILTEKGRGVFNGKIFVRPDAQKTDAKQTNRALLLSKDASVDTKPQLEIFADDVKCTHGATIGEINKEALYYLRARGIGAPEARAMLTHAFATEIISRIKPDTIRDHVNALVHARISQPEFSHA
ncbi:MAG: Fe-S cluster assembly protein SufD [Verrucomicrobiae bacterium]|nr:Fe-S cluster assembly protein SufD [Verrucomicrobiae bacterium]